MAITEHDRDLIARTVLGEGGDEQAIIADILERARNERVTPGEIVLGRGAFPSWDNPRKQRGIDAEGKDYQRVAQLVDKVASDDSRSSILQGLGVTEKPRGTVPPSGRPVAKPAPIAPPVPQTVPAEQSERAKILQQFGITDPEAGGAAAQPKPPGLEQIPGQRNIPSAQARQLSEAIGGAGPVVEGMPVVGPLIEHAGSALSAAIDPGAPGQGDTFGERYHNRLSLLHQANQYYREQNPATALGGNLLGSAMTLGPFSATVPGRLALGLPTQWTPRIGPQMWSGGIGGGTVNALDAALRGDSVYGGALWGAGAGVTAPVITSTVGKAIPSLFALGGGPRELRDLNPTARSWLIDAARAGATDPVGKAGFFGESNPALTRILQGIFHTSEEGADIIRQAYGQRTAGAMSRVTGYLDDAFGPRVNVLQRQAQIEASQSAGSDPLYKAARATKIVPSDELKGLIPRLQKAGAFERAKYLSGIKGEEIDEVGFSPMWMHEDNPERWPTVQSWMWIKRGLDSKIGEAQRAGDKEAAAQLIGLKKEMVGEIGKTNAGALWRQADKHWSTHERLIEELEAGRSAFVGGRSGTTVDEFLDELSHLSGPERAARIEGARDVLGEAMGDTLRGVGNTRDKLLADNNRKKLAALIGDDRAEQLLHRLEAERTISSVTGGKTQQVIGGSQTAGNTEAVKALQPPPVEDSWNPDLGKPVTWLPFLPRIWKEMHPATAIQGAREEVYRRARNALAEILTRPNEVGWSLDLTRGPPTGPTSAALAAESLRRVGVQRHHGSAGNALAVTTASGVPALRLRSGEPPRPPALISPAQ